MVFSKNYCVYLLALCLFIVGCGQDQERPTEKVSDESKIMEGTREKASEIEESVEKKSDETETKGSGMIEKVKSEAEKIKEKTSSVIGEQVDKVKDVFDKGKEEAISEHGDEAESKVDQTVEEESSKIDSLKEKTSSIVKELIAKAKALFDKGEYEESITAAQDVLTNHDSDSQEAKDIITKAKEKLRELVPDEASKKVEGLKENITDKLKDLGH